MGIRGAWSVISKDPSRFGHRWVLQNCENSKDSQITIVLDGPSLLYHVATSYPTDKSGSTLGLLSPSAIYTGTIEFVQALIEVSGSKGELHVVMDGLSPKEKIPAQIQRMANQALECDAIANSTANGKVSRCEMLPLFAEAAMIEGLEAMKSAGNVRLHRPLHGEAETYIARWLDGDNRQSENIFIFSDDTDFLVYPSCPGFIPFRSLKFTTIGADKCLTGYLYLRSKFMAAFFPIEEEENEDIMPIVAALAGCDYRLSNDKESLLQNARTFIVQSNIGGLRQRMRNAPSGMATITAILRFVAHYYVQSQRKASSNSQGTVGKVWLSSLARGLHCEGQGREERRDHFIEALEDIRQIYFSTECQRGECPSRSMLWNDLVRLVEWRVLYCRPVVETWDSSALCKQTHERRSKRSKKKSKRSKRPLNKTVQQEETLSSESNIDLDTQGDVSTWTISASIWTLPHFCSIRKRVYRVLQELITEKSVLANSTPCTPSSSVSEYMRYGNRHNVEFKEKLVTINSDSTNVIASTLSSVDDILLWSVFGDYALELDEKDLLLRQDCLLFLTSLMLPAREALLLLIVGTAPRKVTLSRRLESDCSTAVEVLSLINVACFHATLAINASLYIMSSDRLEGFDRKAYGIQINDVFRYDLAEAILQGIPEVDGALITRNEQANSANGVLDTVFERMVSIHGVRCETQADLECWRNKAYHLWVEKWSQVQDKIVINR